LSIIRTAHMKDSVGEEEEEEEEEERS